MPKPSCIPLVQVFDVASSQPLVTIESQDSGRAAYIHHAGSNVPEHQLWLCAAHTQPTSLLRSVVATLVQVLVPGCRMAGDVMTVTQAAGNVIYALNDRPVHDSVSISNDSTNALRQYQHCLHRNAAAR
jgi:hypothetical protein